MITDGIVTKESGTRVRSRHTPHPDPGAVVIPEGTSTGEITDCSFTGLRDAQPTHVATITETHKTFLARRRLITSTVLHTDH